ncbi:uncharacterized protein LOC129569475 [Sitodiplosis mosellana]|uniref:uncharacterized protein LOC129569475 n=1 Tax=Sitodiplosis mosellana TaxID=263140 RepID=UPI00244508F5|nr:uncharacterized protein LOC129569475 [Sitodiplosis mosellana]
MSEKNDDNQHSPETDKTKESEASHQNELSAALNAINLGTKVVPPIFNLWIDCLEEIFDWLSINDIHSFGQTCTKFYQIVGVYFKWKYKRVLGNVYDDSMTVNWKYLNGFNEFAQRLSFYSREPDRSLLFALANCKSPKEINIVNAHFSELDIQPFESMLSKIEIMRLSCHLSGEFYESFLGPCANLKRLRIDKSPSNGWMRNKYPTLEHLEVYECDPSQDNDLKIFLEQNPNVRSLSTTAELLLRNRVIFMASNFGLDDLTILRVDDIDLISIALIELHQRGFYKRLHFKTDTAKHLDQLLGLATLRVYRYERIKMPHLPTVKTLVFKAIWNGQCSWMNDVSMALNNLERIFTPKTSTEYILPFIQNSTKLREITMAGLRGEIDVVAMNNERKRLKMARKVTIYLEEKDYLKLKWKHACTDFGLIELKRNKSYDGVWDYTFGSYY